MTHDAMLGAVALLYMVCQLSVMLFVFYHKKYAKYEGPVLGVFAVLFLLVVFCLDPLVAMLMVLFIGVVCSMLAAVMFLTI